MEGPCECSIEPPGSTRHGIGLLIKHRTLPKMLTTVSVYARISWEFGTSGKRKTQAFFFFYLCSMSYRTLRERAHLDARDTCVMCMHMAPRKPGM